MIVKVCGMTGGKNVRMVEEAGAEWMGFIFYPLSPRFASRMPDYLPERAKRVGVFVNASAEDIASAVRRWKLDLVQLHGKESPAQCRDVRTLGVKIVKAFAIKSREDLAKVSGYAKACDCFLFDTPCAEYGGSGRRFDWSLLEAYRGDTPFLLSGGLNPESLGALSEFSHPQWAGIDLNSGFELKPGIKDAEAVGRFIRAFRQLRKTPPHSG